MQSLLPGFAKQSRRSMWVAAVVGCVACAYAAAQPPAHHGRPAHVAPPTLVPPTVVPCPPGLPPAAETHRNAACPPAGSAFPASLPPAPVSPARPATGSGAVNEFVDGVGHNDASFEVLVGQGRILTTKVDLAVRGKPSALVAVGDPTVFDFVVVNARQIRVIGQRIGVSDLSITTPDGQTYGFEVRVVADLHVLQRHLNCLFPDASVKLTQVRDHVAVEGQARDAVQVNRILETVRAYLESVQTGQARRISGQREGPREPGPAGKGDAPAQGARRPDEASRGRPRAGRAGRGSGHHRGPAGDQPAPRPGLSTGPPQGPGGRAEPDGLPPDRGGLPDPVWRGDDRQPDRRFHGVCGGGQLGDGGDGRGCRRGLTGGVRRDPARGEQHRVRHLRSGRLRLLLQRPPTELGAARPGRAEPGRPERSLRHLPGRRRVPDSRPPGGRRGGRRDRGDHHPVPGVRRPAGLPPDHPGR